MPKFLAGKITIRTFETFAKSPEEAEGFIYKWQEGESEEPESGVKATSYKLMWQEFDCADPTEARNKVLQQFLNLMQNQIPGMPKRSATEARSAIIHPFTLEIVTDLTESQEKKDGMSPM